MLEITTTQIVVGTALYTIALFSLIAVAYILNIRNIYQCEIMQRDEEIELLKAALKITTNALTIEQIKEIENKLLNNTKN